MKKITHKQIMKYCKDNSIEVYPEKAFNGQYLYWLLKESERPKDYYSIYEFGQLTEKEREEYRYKCDHSMLDIDTIKI